MCALVQLLADKDQMLAEHVQGQVDIFHPQAARMILNVRNNIMDQMGRIDNKTVDQHRRRSQKL